ncbi:MAG: cytochrome c [Acidimicrobiales bacterium]
MGIALVLLMSACGGAVDAGTFSVPISASVAPGDPVSGAQAYRSVCASCHGADLGGVSGLGRSLMPSRFITERSNDELAAFIVEGRPIDDPDNTTGVPMFPRAGNPFLTDQDIANIVVYIKAQQPITDN